MAGRLNSVITGKNSIRPNCCYTFPVPGYINLHHNIQQFQQNIIQLGSLELKVGGCEGLMSLLFQGSSKLPMEFERLRLSQLYFSLFWSPLHICNFFTFLKVHQFEKIWRELLVKIRSAITFVWRPKVDIDLPATLPQDKLPQLTLVYPSKWTLYTSTSVCIFFILFCICFLWQRHGEYV